MGDSIEIPSQWEELQPDSLTGTVFFLGAVDRGKSTLVRWVAQRLAGSGRKVGWLDGDIGQSTLGVPGSMHLAVLDQPSEELPQAQASFFVGATSPRGHMLPVLVGLRRLRDRALAGGAETVLVDTTGFVAAEGGGGALKEWKVELLQPQTVIALQAGRELEHILAPLRRDRRMLLHALEPVAAVRQRSQEERAGRRSRLFREYFAGAEPVRLRLGTKPVYGLEKGGSGRLLSLNDQEGFSLALGILLSRRGGELEILTPLQDMGKAAGVRIGDLVLDGGTGEEVQT